MSVPDLALPAAAEAAGLAPVDRRPGTPAGPGMRAKGWILLACLFAYLAIMCALVLTRMDATVARQQALAAQAAQLATLDGERALLHFSGAGGPAGAVRLAETDPGDRWHAMLAAVANASPSIAPATLAMARGSLDALDSALRAYRSAATDDNASRVVRHAAEAARALSAAGGEVGVELDQRTEQFRSEQRVGAGLLIGAGLIGIALLAVAVFAFLSRVVADVRALMGRTGEIVAGRAPLPMPPTRFDELGDLSAAIDELAVALQRRERDLELERRKGFHREKMAAIGSLAAGVLTEIGNPIAAIDGIARAMREGTDGARAGAVDTATPEAILEQTERLMVVTRQIAEFAAPQPSRRELIDINAVVERALGLLRFDDAMRGIEVELALDRQLGAIAGMTDRLVQLLMNLIGNATDALQQGRTTRPSLRIATRRDGNDVVLAVSDNGVGMADEVRTRAFEPFFSTKPAGRRTGLGLPLCQSIVADHGGRIDVASAAGVGTCVTIHLPPAPPDAPA